MDGPHELVLEKIDFGGKAKKKGARGGEVTAVTPDHQVIIPTPPKQPVISIADVKNKPESQTECGLLAEKTKDGVCLSDATIGALESIISDAKKINSPKEIVEAAKEETGAKNQRELVKVLETQGIISSEKAAAEEKNLKPEGPCNKEWLSNENIDQFLRALQDKKLFPNYKHVDYKMIDFTDTRNELNTPNVLIDLAKNNTKNCLGVVLNTDTSSGSGIHWFAMFCDFRTPGTTASPWTIEYFNSSGNMPHENVIQWRNDQRMGLLKAFPDKAVEIVNVSDGIVHQQDNDTYNCGMYSIYYVWARVMNKPYKWFSESRITRDHMDEMRKQIFHCP